MVRLNCLQPPVLQSTFNFFWGLLNMYFSKISLFYSSSEHTHCHLLSSFSRKTQLLDKGLPQGSLQHHLLCRHMSNLFWLPFYAWFRYYGSCTKILNEDIENKEEVVVLCIETKSYQGSIMLASFWVTQVGMASPNIVGESKANDDGKCNQDGNYFSRNPLFYCILNKSLFLLFLCGCVGS